MTVYILLLIITIFSLYFEKKRECMIYKTVPYISMAFIGGFRYGVGQDYYSYEYIFNNAATIPWIKANIEIGFRILIRTITILGGNSQFLFLVMSCLTCFFYYKFLEENSSDFAMSTMLFMCLGPFYLSSFNIVRQALATAIFFYALKYSYTDIKKYICFILGASLIHKSALIFLLYPLSVYLKKNYLIYFVGASAIGFVFIRTRLFNSIISMFPKMGNYGSMSDNRWNANYLMYFIICFFIIAINQLHNKIDKHYMYLLIYTCTLIAWGYGMNQYSLLITRFISWGLPALLIAIPGAVSKVKQRNICVFLIYNFCIVYFVRVILTGAKILPFQFNFNILQ